MNLNMPHKNTKETKRGFTLLFAVLVSTLVVAIGATVISIALRQTVLSGTSRESQYAFYAANTALECAYYWDVVGIEGSSNVVFPSDEETGVASGEEDLVRCGGGEIMTGAGFETDFVTGQPWTQANGVTTFKMEIRDRTDDFDHVYCAEATVVKEESTEPGKEGVFNVVISAKGYNTCDLTSPRAVERGLVQSYES